MRTNIQCQRKRLNEENHHRFRYNSLQLRGFVALRVSSITLFIVLTVTAGFARPLAVHEKFKIVGSVLAFAKDEIAVKAIDGATYEIDLHDSTVVTDNNHKKIARGHVKVGARVVVLALGHDMFDLEAFEIQLLDK
jgi:hypothetical protein